MEKKKAKRDLKTDAHTLSDNSRVENIEREETTQMSPIESVRHDISSDRHSIGICNQMVSEGDNEVSLLGFESNSLIESNCHVNSISNSESQISGFLNCLTSTPTRPKAKTINNTAQCQLDLSSIYCDSQNTESSLFLSERQISRFQITDEFVSTIDDELTNTFEKTEDVQEKDQQL